MRRNGHLGEARRTHYWCRHQRYWNYRKPRSISRTHAPNWRANGTSKNGQIFLRRQGNCPRIWLPALYPPFLYFRWFRRKHLTWAQRIRQPLRARLAVVSDPRGHDRQSTFGLERIRTRALARCQRQRRDHLLYRKLWPNGHPYRRLHHGGARHDPFRYHLPKNARYGHQHDAFYR